MIVASCCVIIGPMYYLRRFHFTPLAQLGLLLQSNRRYLVPHIAAVPHALTVRRIVIIHLCEVEAEVGHHLAALPTLAEFL